MNYAVHNAGGVDYENGIIINHIAWFVCCLIFRMHSLSVCPTSDRRRLWGSPQIKKITKGDIVPFGQPPLPPKQVKRGHLLSDYRQKCVNATRDSRFCPLFLPFFFLEGFPNSQWRKTLRVQRVQLQMFTSVNA